MMTSTAKPGPVESVAVFIDGETLPRGLALADWLALRRAFEPAGPVTLSRVYVALSEQSFVQAVGLTVRAAEGDEAVSLALEVSEAMYLKPHVQRFILVGLSRHMRPVARRLREFGKRVWMWQEIGGSLVSGLDAEWVGCWQQVLEGVGHITKEGRTISASVEVPEVELELPFLSAEKAESLAFDLTAPPTMALREIGAEKREKAPRVSAPPTIESDELPLLANTPWVLVK